MFKKNTAVTGFAFALVSATDGSAITSGTVTGYYTLDGGTQGTIAGTAVHEGNGQWSINLLAAEMNGDIVGLLFTHASAVNAHFTIKTDTKLVSELQDLTAAQVNTEADTAISDAALATAAALATVDTVVDGIQTDLDNGTDGLGAIKTAVDGLNDPTAAAIADAVWDESTAGHTTAGTFGEQCKTDIDAILADTNELQSDWANGGRLDLILDARSSQASVDVIDGNVDAILLDTGTDGVVISAATANQIADAILNRDFSAVSDTNARTLLNAARFLRNKYSVSGTTLTVTKEDDSTSAWTSILTTDAAADPVTGSDPA